MNNLYESNCIIMHDIFCRWFNGELQFVNYTPENTLAHTLIQRKAGKDCLQRHLSDDLDSASRKSTWITKEKNLWGRLFEHFFDSEDKLWYDTKEKISSFSYENCTNWFLFIAMNVDNLSDPWDNLLTYITMDYGSAYKKMHNSMSYIAGY